MQSADGSEDVVLGYRKEVLALHSGRATEPRPASLGSCRINENLCRFLTGESHVTANHCEDRILQATVIAVGLDHESGTVLSSSSSDVGKLHDDDIASATHARLPRERSW